MGYYKLKNESLEKYYKSHKYGILDNLTERIHQYISPGEKTIDEVLDKLYQIQEEMEDRVGAIMRILKFQRQNAKLNEEQELKLIDSQNLRILIHDVEELKKWVEEG